MKKIRLQYFLVATVTALFGFMTGCSDSGSGAATPSANTVSGVAASGAPIVGTVTARDAAGKTSQTPATISADGSYKIDVTGMQAPYLLKATPKDTSKPSMYSFASEPGMANINPLSNLIVANAAGVTDTSSLSTADKAMMNKIKTVLAASTASMQVRLGSLFSRYNVASVDPIKDPYPAAHQGIDLMFDDADFQVTNGSLKIKNRKDNSECFTGNLADDKNDTVTDANLPTPGQGGGTATAPAAPTVTATADATQNSVSWPAVSGATSYDLYWSTTTGVTTANGTKIANVTSPYAHTGLTAGTPYYYIVTASNAAGTSAASAQATATPTAASQGTAPAAPAATATAGTAQNTITWPAVTGATSYDLYWSTTTGVTTANGTKIANVTSPYAHTGLTAGTPYYYILTATNATGTSPASTQVTATPTAAATTPDGAALYAANCQGCHGPLATSTKRGSSAANIHAGIAANLGGMGSLVNLTNAQVSAIAVALGGAP